MIKIPNCRLFTGYKPCEPFKNCLDCRDQIPFGSRILLINLDALGDVLVTTSMLAAIKRKYPESTINWLTLKSSVPLLENNPLIDKIWLWENNSLLALSGMFFDVLFNADKNQNSCALTNQIEAIEKYGFGLNRDGQIIPLNKGAEYNYRMGLEDKLKFEFNKRTGQDILAETFDLPFQRDEYILNLTKSELEEVKNIRKKFQIDAKKFVIGFNTGCSAKFTHKKLTVEQHVDLIKLLQKKFPEIEVLLLGGKEDTERNRLIEKKAPASIISTPTEEGLRRGILYEAVCDLIVSGDSLGMHIGIALKKTVLAWFGMTSFQEIDLYDRGEMIISKVSCSPCWSNVCLTGNLECIHELDLNEFVAAIGKIYSAWRSDL